MELYKPSQGLIWVYDKRANNNKGALYIQSTYYVYVATSQSIASNPGDLVLGEAKLELNVRGESDPAYPPRLQSSSVWIRTDESVPANHSEDNETVKNEVKGYLETNGITFKVTAIVLHPDGSEGGSATNLITEADEIEVL